MVSRTIFFLLLVALIEIKAKELDPGPQVFKESSPTKSISSEGSDAKSQKRYATKEVILYLTPTQIKALKAGNGLISAQTSPKSEEQQISQQLSLKEHEELIKQQFENIKAAPVKEPQYENFDSAAFSKEELSNENLQKNVDFFNIWKQEQARVEQQAKAEEQARAEEQAKSEYAFSQFRGNDQIEQWQVPKEIHPEVEKNAWLSYGPVSEKNQEDRLLHEQLNNQWNHILDQNRLQLKALSALTEEKSNSESLFTQTEKPLLQMQYAPRYNDQKNAIEIEKLVRQNHRQELEKQSALAQAEAIANAPPILVHQEVKITKHHPVPIVKHVKVSVPTPVLVPIPEPYEVKVPHPYPVPLEIIKHIPVPILKTERIEVEKPVPYEVEKHVPVPVTKQVFVNVNRPYYVPKLVPVEVKKEVPVEIPIRKAEKITILRHVWNH